MENAKAYGAILLIAGLFIRYQIGKRRFNRRSITGLAIYSSYLRGLIMGIIETLFNVIGAILIIAGLLSILIH